MSDDLILKQSLSEKVANRIREQILNTTFTPGERLVVDNLSEKYGVSKTPVREALVEIFKEGFLLYNGSSYFIPDINPKDVKEIYAIRRPLEALSITLAVEYANAEEVVKISQIVEKSEQMTNESFNNAIIDLDTAFHDYIAKFSRNRLLRMILKKLNNLQIGRAHV